MATFAEQFEKKYKSSTSGQAGSSFAKTFETKGAGASILDEYRRKQAEREQARKQELIKKSNEDALKYAKQTQPGWSLQGMGNAINTFLGKGRSMPALVNENPDYTQERLASEQNTQRGVGSRIVGGAKAVGNMMIEGEKALADGMGNILSMRNIAESRRKEVEDNTKYILEWNRKLKETQDEAKRYEIQSRMESLRNKNEQILSEIKTDLTPQELRSVLSGAVETGIDVGTLGLGSLFKKGLGFLGKKAVQEVAETGVEKGVLQTAKKVATSPLTEGAIFGSTYGLTNTARQENPTGGDYTVGGGLGTLFGVGGVLGGKYAGKLVANRAAKRAEKEAIANIEKSFEKLDADERAVVREALKDGVPEEEVLMQIREARRAFDEIEPEAPREPVAGTVGSTLPRETIDTVEGVRNYMVEPTRRIDDKTIASLSKNPIFDEGKISFDKDGNIILYRKGNVEPGKPNSYSLIQGDDQVPYVINKSDILVDTTSRKYRDALEKTYTDPAMKEASLYALKAYNNLESEIIAIPKKSIQPQSSSLIQGVEKLAKQGEANAVRAKVKAPTEEMDLGKKTPTVEAKKGEYFYHGTNESVLDNVLKEGLKPGRRGQLSLSKDEAYARSFARDGMTPQGKTNAVTFRVKSSLLKGKTTTKRLDGKQRPAGDQLNELLTKETISPESIEVYKNGKWRPLKESPGGGKPPKKTPPTAEAQKSPERKQSNFAKRLNEELPENLKIDEEYDVAALKGEADKAADLIEKDLDKAIRIASGAEKSSANTQTAVSIALAEKAKADGSWEIVAKLFNERRLANTRRGQEIAMEKLSIALNPEEHYMKQVIENRMAKVRLGVEAFKKADTRSKRVARKVAKDTETLKKNLKQSFKIKEAQGLLNKLTCK